MSQPNSNSRSLPNRGKLLALDLGRRHTGVAISDMDQSIAFPREEMVHKNLDELFQQVQAFVEKEKIVGIVIGLPLNMSGGDSEQTTWSREVASTIQKLTQLPIELIDERLSTHHASIKMKTTKNVDSESAQLLLEALLR